MSERKDIIKLDIEVNGNKAQKELFQLEEKAAELAKEMKGLKKTSQEYIDKQKELAKVRADIDNLRSSMNIANLTQKQLNQEIARLRQIRSNLAPGSEAFRQYTQRIEEARARQQQLANGTTAFSRLFSGLNRQMLQFGAMMAAYFGLSSMINGFKSLVQSSAQLSDNLADVRKTTGFNAKEVDEFNKKLKTIDTRTPRAELLKMAEAGGRMGIAKNEIFDFVKAMDQANVALGDEFTGGAEEIATQLGKIKSLFKETRDLKIEDAYMAIGSALNEVSANTKATSPEIAEFTKRIGALPDALKPTIQDVISLSAITQEAGIDAEISSRGFTIFFTTAAENSEKFAKFMGISTEAVEEMINTDVVAFTKEFASKLKDLSAVDTAKTLKELGISATGTQMVIGSLSSNMERFTEIQEITNKSYKDAISLTDEFSIKNENLAAKYAKLMRTLNTLFVNSAVMKGIERMVDFTSDLVGVTQRHSEVLRDEQAELNRLVISLEGANLGTEERKGLIEELQAKYPGFLNNINAEVATNEELEVALAAANRQYIAKIALATKAEAIDAILIKAGNTAAKLANENVRILDEVARLKKLLETNDKDVPIRGINQSLSEYAVQLTELSRGLKQSFIDYDSKFTTPKVTDVDFGGVTRLDQLDDKLTRQQDLAIELNREYELMKEQLQDILGIDLTAPTPPPTKPIVTPASDYQLEEDTKTKEKVIDYAQQLQDRLQKMRESAELDKLDGMDRERAALALTFSKELDFAREHELNKFEIIKTWSDLDALIVERYATEDAARKEELRQQELAKYQDFLANISNLSEDVRISQLASDEQEIERIKAKYEILNEENQKYFEDSTIDFYDYYANLALLKKLYDIEIAESEKNRTDLTNKYAKDEKNVKIREAKAWIGSVTNLLSGLAETQYGLLVFQQLASLASITLSEGVAIANVIKNAADFKFPANLFAIATSITTVVASMAQAYGALKRSPEPPKPRIKTINQKEQGGFVDVIGKQTGKKYRAQKRPDIEGGYINNNSLVLAGEDGKQEYFVNSTMLDIPEVNGVVGAMEALRNGAITIPDFNNILSNISVNQFKNGGYTNSTSPFDGISKSENNNDLAITLKELSRTQQLLLQQLQVGIKSFIPDDTIEDLNIRQELIKTIQNNAK